MKNDLFTIADLIQYVHQGKDFYFYCPVFLDSFYSSNDEIKYELIKDEPKQYDNVDHFYYCDVAGIVHKLANDYNVLVPDWVHKPEYVLKEAYYQRNTKNKILQEYYKKNSPHEFKIRNIFVDTNSLDRV